MYLHISPDVHGKLHRFWYHTVLWEHHLSLSPCKKGKCQHIHYQCFYSSDCVFHQFVTLILVESESSVGKSQKWYHFFPDAFVSVVDLNGFRPHPRRTLEVVRKLQLRIWVPREWGKIPQVLKNEGSAAYSI